MKKKNWEIYYISINLFLPLASEEAVFQHAQISDIGTQ